MRLITGVIIAAIFALASSFPGFADDAARAQLAGRTLDVVATFNNTGSGARLWSVLSADLAKRLPETQIRTRFNDAGDGVAALNELFADTDGSLSIVFALIPELAYAQTESREGVAYDFNTAQWIIGLQRQGQVMAVRKGLSLDIDTLRQPGQRILVPVDTINGNSALMHLILNAVTGLRAQMVVGFNSAESQRALLVGDVDMRRQQTAPDVNALLESGEIASLYTIAGTGFPPQVDTTHDLASVTLPGTPQAVIDYVVAMTQLGRAFLAAPTADPADVAALRTVFAEMLSDPAVLDEAAKQFAVVTMVPPDEVKAMMDHLLLVDPKTKAAVALAHSCGLAMSRGTLDRCDFSTLEQ